jgi:hypothetical protein
LKNKGFQPGAHHCEVFGHSGDPVVCQHQSFKPQQLRKFLQFSDVVVGQVDAGKLIVGGGQVLEVGDAAAP